MNGDPLEFEWNEGFELLQAGLRESIKRLQTLDPRTW